MATGIYQRTKPVSVETRLKMSLVKSGKPKSAEHRAHMCLDRIAPLSKKERQARYYDRKYGMAIGESAVRLAAQGGCCALCHIEIKKFYRDHDHETGKTRGLVCRSCNSHIIGSNTLETARELVIYLEMARHGLPQGMSLSFT